MIDLGTVKPGRTIRIPFSSFDKDDGSSITMTNYAVADILIYKDGSTTERASTAGFTATTDFDAKTGKHVCIIDLADNTTADFFQAGSEYLVAIDAVTVDAVTTGGWIARFLIGYPGAVLDTFLATLTNQTSFTLNAGPAEDDALNGMWCVLHDTASAVQAAFAVIQDYTGASKTVTLAVAPSFTIAAKDNISVMGPAPLQPTTEKLLSAARALDVSAGGESGLDWANIGSPTTAQNLSATNIDTDQVVASVSGAVGSVGAGGIAAASFAAGAIDAAAIAADAIGSSELAASAVTEIQAGLSTLDAAAVRVALGLSSANLDTQLSGIPLAVWTYSLRNLTGNRSGTAQGGGASSITLDAGASATDNLYNGQLVWVSSNTGAGQVRRITAYNGTTKVATVERAWQTNPDNTSGFVLYQDSGPAVDSSLAIDAASIRAAVGLASANLDTQLAAIDDAVDTEVASILAAVDTEVAAIKAKTDNLPAAPAATGDIPTVSQIWTTALTEAYRSAGAAGTAAQLLHEILQNLTEFSISGTTKTVKKFDASTTAKTYTLNDATTPTAITETT